MTDAAWAIAWLSGWVVWLVFGWWTLVQTRAFIAEGRSVLTRVNPVRSVACMWAVLLFSLFSGVGRLHLLWIAQLIMFAPPILSARAVRQVGIPHGVLGYVIGFVGITAVSGMAAWDLAGVVGLHIGAYHVLLFAIGGGTALWFRSHFWNVLKAAEGVLQTGGSLARHAEPETATTPIDSNHDKVAPEQPAEDDGQYLTPELIGKWLVGQQRTSFTALMDAAGGRDSQLPPLELSVEAVTEIAVHSYALQVSIVCLTYQQMLDDSEFLTGHEGGDVDMRSFLHRIHSGARAEGKKFIVIKSADFEPFAVAGCVLQPEAVMPHILGCYSAFFAPLDSLEILPVDAVRFAQAMLQQMQTTAPLAAPAALAYYFGFRELLTDRGRASSPDPRATTEPRSAAVILRTWGVWVENAVDFQRKLIQFHGKRAMAFS